MSLLILTIKSPMDRTADHFFIAASCHPLRGQSLKPGKEPFKPLSHAAADQKADSVLSQMTLDEKIALIGGDRIFFVRSVPRLNLPEIYMADATQGVHIREKFNEIDLSEYRLEKSTAFPSPILLASTWNQELSYAYAEAIGEECRAGNIGILLGPGMNMYRHSQCGRNFEYFGEDPFLAGSMIASYVRGLQSTGTVATLKHFVANNTEYFRRKSNSVIDERALNEIYLPSFRAGIDAGARAVMTSYNLLNGEWCGQSEAAIHSILRKQLGFQWLVMTDWLSVDDGEKLAKSGQDLEMPYAIALKDAHKLIGEGKVKIEDIDRMVKSILKTCFAMKLYGRQKNPLNNDTYENHESIALRTAREGIVLLKNQDDILPIKKNVNEILLTGDFVKTLAVGGGAATVEGYNNRIMFDELKRRLGDRLSDAKNPSVREIKSADVVLCNVGTHDSEGWDRPFELPKRQERRVKKCAANNPNTIVIVTSGSGIRMTDWSDQAKAIIYAWYGGQTGNQALAEIITGEINPSGKLPITIEKDFRDSPGFGYIPVGEKLYSWWNDDGEKKRSVYDVHYKEGIFMGYRWYENEKIEPLFPFGHGLSYTTFSYRNLKVSKEEFKRSDVVTVSFVVENIGTLRGMETAQLYIQDVECSFPRPMKELKGFRKIELEPGQAAVITLELSIRDFSFWNPGTKKWSAESGVFVIHVGSSSRDIELSKEIVLLAAAQR